MKKVLLVLALFLLGSIVLSGKVYANQDGDCFCKTFNDEAGLYDPENILSELAQSECKTPVKIMVGKVTNYKGEWTCPEDQPNAALYHRDSRYIKCSPAAHDGNKCYCLDTKTICRWEPKSEYCCCAESSSKAGTIDSCVKIKSETSQQYCGKKIFESGGGDIDFFEWGGSCICDDLSEPINPTVSVPRPNNPNPNHPCFEFGKIDREPYFDCLPSNSSPRECTCKDRRQTSYPRVSAGLFKQNCTKDFKSALYANCKWQQGFLTSEPGYKILPIDKTNCASYSGTIHNTAPIDVTIKDLQNKAKSLNQLSFRNPAEFVGQLVKVLLAFIGSIALILYIYAGIMWMRSSGNSEEIGKAQQILVWTTLGVAVMLGSYLLVNFIFGNILKLL